MGFDNPQIPWRELERRLSGRPDPSTPDRPGDGGDSPAWSRKRAAYEPAEVSRPAVAVPYAELHAHSSFSFLDGASSPEELAEEATRLGLETLTLTDHDGVYGLVRFAEAATAYGLRTAFGAELSLDVPVAQTQSEQMIATRVGVPDPPGTHLLALARGPEGYARLSRAIGQAHLRGGAKGRPAYDDLEALGAAADGQWLVLTGCRKGSVRQALDTGGETAARRALGDLVHHFGCDNVVVELTHELDPLADERYEVLAALAAEARLPVVATTAAHFHGPPRRPLATAMAAVRARSSLDEIDGWLPSWSGQHLRSGAEMAQRFARWPDAVSNAARLAGEITFSLQLIAPDLPPFPCPDGLTEMQYLRRLTYEGAARWFGGTPHEARAYDMIEHELEIIEDLHFPGYFLVVWDIARFCRER
ncbi:MAG: PHP domain-containing protein, partial [Jatrophihabitans sp.]